MSESSWSLGSSLGKLFGSHKITEETWEELEAALLKADFGADLTEDLVDALRGAASKYRTDDARDLKRMLTEMNRRAVRQIRPDFEIGRTQTSCGLGCWCQRSWQNHHNW